MEINHKLKEARKAKSLSLEDIHEITKIQPHYLAAIEEGDFSRIRGEFYIQAFLKAYAKAVDIDPTRLLDEYIEETPSVESQSDLDILSLKTKAGAGFSFNHFAGLWLSPFVIIIPLLLVILFSGWIYIASSYNSEDNMNRNSQMEEEGVTVIGPIHDNGKENKISKSSDPFFKKRSFLGSIIGVEKSKSETNNTKTPVFFMSLQSMEQESKQKTPIYSGIDGSVSSE